MSLEPSCPTQGERGKGLPSAIVMLLKVHDVWNRTSGPIALLSVSHCAALKALSKPISTNTAINRSLRQSSRSSRGDYTPGPWASCERRPYEDGLNQRPKRPPRPNHQQGLDVEDRFEGKGPRGPSRTPQQEKYRRGGRPLAPPRRYRDLRHSDNASDEPASKFEERGSKLVRQGWHADQYRHSRSPADKAFTAARQHPKAQHEPSLGINRRSTQERQNLVSYRSAGDDVHGKASAGNSDLRNFNMSRDTPHFASQADASDFSQHGQMDSLQRRHSSPALLSIPYTTPASEFLYGTNVVLAALKSARRKIYRIYIEHRANRQHLSRQHLIERLANERGIGVTYKEGDEVRLMDKLSTGRPHNVNHPVQSPRKPSKNSNQSIQGYIVEASPLPKLPVKGLEPVKQVKGTLRVLLDHQSREESEVNGNNNIIEYGATHPRYPLIIMLDGIVSTHHRSPRM